MNQLNATLEISEVIFGKIDKFIKFTEHLIQEVGDNPKFAQYFRGENFVDDLLKFLLEEEIINFKEYSDLQSHSIELTIFYILEMLLEKEVLFSYDAEADIPQSAITTLYAWQIYERLGVLLNKKIIPYPYGKKETLLITDMRGKTNKILQDENSISDDELLKSNSGEIIESLLSGNHDNLSHEYLNEFLGFLKNIIPHKPFYMRILHIEFDELSEINSVFHKALHVLGILICDVLDYHHPIFEDGCEFLLVNLKAKKTKRALMNIYDQKRLNNNPTSP